jgi:hypothetical protein
MTTATSAATDALGAFEGALNKIPGLFDTSEVTQEQLDAAAAGIPQNFADDFLRRAKDELIGSMGPDGKMVTTDWAEVDPAQIAAMLNLPKDLPGKVLYQALQAAWDDSSLFADPKNMELVNMDAALASIERSKKSAEGEANLRALFGLGEEETVTAVAGLGLEVQNGLAGWLQANGLPTAGLATANALGQGVTDNADALGGGVATGLFNWIASAAGKSDMEDAGKRIAANISAAMDVTPNVLPPGTRDRTAPTGGLGGAAVNGNATGAGFWQGGYTMVGEAGAELVWLPRGSRISSAGETKRGAAGAGGAVVNNFNAVINNRVDEAAFRQQVLGVLRGLKWG